MNVISYIGVLAIPATSQKLALTVASAQSAVINGTARPGNGLTALLALDTPAFVRAGANPTVAVDGTDQYLPAGLHRLEGLQTTDKLAIAAVTGTGNAYISPVV